MPGIGAWRFILTAESYSAPAVIIHQWRFTDVEVRISTQIRVDRLVLTPGDRGRDYREGVGTVIPAQADSNRLDVARQGELKSRSPLRIGSGPQGAAVRLDDGPADRQSHAGTLGSGGKKCVKDLVLTLRRQSDTVIADRDQQLILRIPLRPYGKFPCDIERKVHEDLLQLHAVHCDIGQVRRKFGMDQN